MIYGDLIGFEPASRKPANVNNPEKGWWTTLGQKYVVKALSIRLLNKNL